MERYICIHGHFYQPPRENPWIETIELQDSAQPYHDWNERISAECYSPNCASRILDGEGRITEIVNNYARISFNFGPTLLAWLEALDPETYRCILDADAESRKSFSDHGSAMAQVYNHIIMPLANSRDKRTQVIWGIRDFEERFHRYPEGMWLAETAVDLETLEILAEHDIKFTVLAPRQAHRVHPLGQEAWHDVTGEKIDPTRVYEQVLPSGRKIALFFYDGPISRGVAFEGLLKRGESLAHRLAEAFSDDRDWPQLVHIATDGETFGHHHTLGEMALSYALHFIEANGIAKLTNYGEYLEKFPPTHQVEIQENSSWSCVHGVERWRSDCGCSSGIHGGWNQVWRAPLREALDWLRDQAAPLYLKDMTGLLKDPWAARDDYIRVIHDRSPERVREFLNEHAGRSLKNDEIIHILKTLELQRHALLMYTSCGWFFDEISGIETVQVIQYAARVIQLAREIWKRDFEPEFLERLSHAVSNIPAHHNGRWIYENFVRPATINLNKVGAHYAISSLFEDYPEKARIYCFTATRQDYQLRSTGRERMAIGRVKIVSEITWESTDLSFGVLHLGDHNLNGGVREYGGEVAYDTLVSEGQAAFAKSDISELIRYLDRNFNASTYSLRSLFKDEQRKILGEILQSSFANAEAVYRQLYERNVPLMRFLSGLAMPQPDAFCKAAEFALTSSLRQAFQEQDLDLNRIASLLEEARSDGIKLFADSLEFTIRKALERQADSFQANPAELDQLQKLEELLDLIQTLPFEVNLRKVQNIYYVMLQNVCPKFMNLFAEEGDMAQLWLTHFAALGEKLRVKVPEMHLVPGEGIQCVL